MKRIKTKPFILCAVGLFTLVSFDSIDLTLMFSFPKDDLVQKDTYLYGARYISGGSRGKIAITDSRANKVFIFTSSGEYIGDMGKPGQGPGEFNNPCRSSLFEEVVVVHDNGNRRIQYFDLHGNFIKSFKLHKTYTDLKLSDNGKILAIPIHNGKSQLIDVLSSDGKYLYSFGEPLQFKAGYVQLNDAVIALNADEVYLAFRYFPIIRKYSLGGNLLGEFEIDTPVIAPLTQFNGKQLKKRLKGERVPFRHIFEDIETNGKNIFLLNFGMSSTQMRILKLELTGKIDAVYSYTNSTPYLSLDFHVEIQNGKELFYVLQVSPKNKVDVFGT